MPYIQMGGVMGGRTTQILCHCFNLISTAYLAEGVGFEPTIRFPVYTLSKRAPSATRPPLRGSPRNITTRLRVTTRAQSAPPRGHRAGWRDAKPGTFPRAFRQLVSRHSVADYSSDWGAW